MKTATATAGYNFNVNWVDFVIIALLLVGFWRGKKRGMSEELLDIIKWAAIVVVGGFLYEPAGRFLASVSVFSPLSCYIGVYGLIALAIVLLFSIIRRGVGSKLVGSDVFGNGEYYLGMLAGGFRYFCVIVVAMSFLNAPYYAPEEIHAKNKYQMDNFGSSFFLTLPDLQQEVFRNSLSGRLAKDYLSLVLMKPTSSDGKSLNNSDNIAHARERSIYDLLDKR